MTIGIGGVSPQQALDGLNNMTQGVAPIALSEFEARIAKAQYLNTGIFPTGPSAHLLERYSVCLPTF